MSNPGLLFVDKLRFILHIVYLFSRADLQNVEARVLSISSPRRFSILDYFHTVWSEARTQHNFQPHKRTTSIKITQTRITFCKFYNNSKLQHHPQLFKQQKPGKFQSKIKVVSLTTIFLSLKGSVSSLLFSCIDINLNRI